MNTNLYVENSNGALKYARKEMFEAVQAYICFYRESKGFTKYYKNEPEEILKKARDKWQTIVNTMNSYALYLGTPLYKKHIDYVNKLKELMEKPDKGQYSVVKEWIEAYPELASMYAGVKVNEKSPEEDIPFMDYYNELRIVVNKEFLRDLI